MEVDTKYNLLRNTLQYFNHIQKTKGLNEKLDYFKKNNYLLSVISVNSKITKEVIDYYNLDKIKDFNLEKNPNFNINWVKYYPNREWDFSKITINPNFNIKWIELYPDRDWDFKILSFNNKFELEWLKLYPDREWNFKILSSKFNFDFEWVKVYPEKDWDFSVFHTQNNFTTKIMELYPNKNWNKYIYNNYERYDCKITDITLKDYINNNTKNEKEFFRMLSKNENFNINWMRQYPNKPWDYSYLLESLNLNIELLECIFNNKIFCNYSSDTKYIYLEYLHLHPNFNFNWVLKYPDIEWCYDEMHLNKNFKFEWVKKLPDKDWDF